MPTTKTITVYKFEELSDKAKDRAYTRWLDGDPYGWHAENRQTMEAFENLFPIWVRWEYDTCNYSTHCTFQGDEAVGALRGWRLATYIWNNYSDDLWEGKYYSKSRYVNGKYEYKSRRSRVILEHSCVLTGYCLDEDILEPIYKFLDKPSDNITFEELLQQCCDSWGKACMEGFAADTTMEAFAEFCEANELTFDASGRRA